MVCYCKAILSVSRFFYQTEIIVVITIDLLCNCFHSLCKKVFSKYIVIVTVYE